MTPGTPLVPVTRDDAYTVSRHTRQGQRVMRDLARGKEARVFDDGIDLDYLEAKVWTEGAYQGRVGVGPRAAFDRFVWRSPTRIGCRLQTGRPDAPLSWVEIKGKMGRGVWVYHLVPRPRPAGP